MCEPTTLLAISTAVSMASAAVGYSQQKSAAKQQEASALEAHTNNMGQLQEQRRQENVKSRTEMSERAQQAAVERSRLRAASAEGGVGGNTIARIMGTNEFALGQDLAMMTENSRNAARQSTMEGVALRSQSQSRLNSIERPSALATGLQIAGIGAGAYDKYKKIK